MDNLKTDYIELLIEKTEAAVVKMITEDMIDENLIVISAPKYLHQIFNCSLRNKNICSVLRGRIIIANYKNCITVFHIDCVKKSFKPIHIKIN